MSDSTRIADLRVSRLTVIFVRYVYPPVGARALVQRRRNRRVVERNAHELGADAARVVVAAQLANGAPAHLRHGRRPIVNAGFVIYSALRQSASHKSS
jgi:hypothetical protein